MSRDVYRTSDDFEDEFSIECTLAGEEWCAVIDTADPVDQRNVILQRGQVEELFLTVGCELGVIGAEPALIIAAQRAERIARDRATREAADAAALRRVNERLEQQNAELRKELGR